MHKTKNGKSKQRGVNKILWMKVNDVGNSERIDHDIYATTFPNMEY